jgi:drug/metabolite transporter (DMT)-like permease
MKNKNITSVLLLLLTSIIWGFAFVAQRKGMESLDPMTFNGIRFALGAIFVGIFMKGRNPSLNSDSSPVTSNVALRTSNFTSFPWLPGIILFIAASLQQIGIIWTTAGNAGFITGLYVVFVPLLGLFLGQKLNPTIYLAVIMSCIGIYLISVKHGLQFNPGDLIVLVSAIFWAIHVQVINRYTKKMDSLSLAFSQYTICAIASLISGFLFIMWKHPQEILDLTIFASIYDAFIPIVYGGIFSVGIAYTLQVEGQKCTAPATASIILCLESVFAMFGGWLLLHEGVSPRMLAGAFLLFSAMFISTVRLKSKLGLQKINSKK